MKFTLTYVIYKKKITTAFTSLNELNKVVLLLIALRVRLDNRGVKGITLWGMRRC